MSNYNTLKTADTINTVSVVDGAITTSKLGASVTTLIVAGGGPKATAITYPGNDLAADPAGGQTITLTGTGFVAGCSVFVGTVQASVVTVVSATSVTFTSPALAAATYTLYLVNPDGGTATIVPGISYSGTPAWSTAAGTLGSVYEYSAVSNTVAATGDGSITYSVFSGTLPTGSSLNTSTGVISGTSPASAGATTYTFVIRATDAQLQDSDRSFSITVNTDTVTWSSPAADSTVTLDKDLASTTALLATSAAGKAITYTSTTLPTGLTISGATVTGTPTAVATTAVTFTATAATSGKTATAVINWTVSVAADTYFQNTTLLLSGAVATETFVADASVNNFPLTISGDTKPNNFNPYTPGYYSNLFDGTGDYLTVPSNAAFAFGTGDYTFECWINTNSTAQQVLFGSGGTGTNNFYFNFSPTSSFIGVGTQLAYVLQATSLSLLTGVWYHVAASRSSGTLKLFLNGAQVASGADSTTWIQGGSPAIGSNAASGQYTNGYISNLRVVNGVAVYTGTFTPPTAPLTATQSSGTNIAAITGTATSLLTCQSNRFLDNSTNAFAITKVGDTTVSPTTPFVPDTAYATYGSTYFDGTGDYLTVPSNAAFAMGSGDFTIEMWVYPVSIPTDTPLIDGRDGAGTAVKPCLFIQQSSNNFIYYVNGGIRIQGGTPSLKTWQHVALVRNSGSTKFYINGTQAGSTYTDTNNYLTCGYRIAAFNDGSTSYCLNGYISNVRVVNGVAVYTSAFTPPSTPLTAVTNTSLLTCQTNQPANNSMFLDSSTNALAVTRTGNASAGTFSPYGANWSNYFDGTGDKLTLPSSSAFDLSDSTWTIEFWMYSLATPPGGNDCRLLIAGANGGAASWDVQYNNNASIGFFRPYGGSPTSIYSSAGTIALNTWYHIAIVCNAGSARLYINGVLVAGPVTISLPTSAAQGLRIGYDDPGTVNFQYNGYLSNVRIVKGVAVYTSAFTPSTTPLTATQSSGTNISAITGTATSLLICKSNRFVDNSTNAFVVTITGDVAVQRFSPFGPSAAYTAGTIGGSAYFDGTGDYLTTPSSSLFNLNGINWTVEGWFNLVSATSDDRLFVFAGASGTWGFYRRAATGNIYFGRFGYDEVLLGNMLLNEWTHLALVRTSGPTISLYKNGVFSASTAAYSMSNENCTFLIAGNPDPYANTVTKGYISDVRVVKGVAVYTANFVPPTAPLTAITNTSLLLNMTTSGIYDSTMINDLETVADAKILSTQTPYAGSYYSNYFDGTGDYLTAPSNAAFTFGTGAFTIEAWIYPTVYGPTTGNWIYSNISAASGNSEIGLLLLNAGTIRLSTWNTAIATSTLTAPLNVWSHVVGSFDGTTYRLFVNGVLSGTSTTVQTLSGTGGAYIGTAGVAGISLFTGYLSNLRIVKGTAVYTGTFTPPTAPLTAIANTSLLTCQSNRFVDNSANAGTITRSGDTSVQSFNPFQRNSAATMSFDGTGDYLLPRAGPQYAFGTGNFTLECWIYSTNANDSPIYEGRNSGASGTAGFTLTAFSSNVIRLYAGGVLISSSGTTYVNIWTHVAVVKSGATTTLYINGTSVGTTAGLTNLTDQSPIIGGGRYLSDSTITTSFTGYINDFRLTKGVARYTSTFTPPTTAFIAR